VTRVKMPLSDGGCNRGMPGRQSARASGAGSNPSHPLIGVTRKWSDAWRGWPHSSTSVSGASWLTRICTSFSALLCVSPK
jgi:hypothetical protein